MKKIAALAIVLLCASASARSSHKRHTNAQTQTDLPKLQAQVCVYTPGDPVTEDCYDDCGDIIRSLQTADFTDGSSVTRDLYYCQSGGIAVSCARTVNSCPNGACLAAQSPDILPCS